MCDIQLTLNYLLLAWRMSNIYNEVLRGTVDSTAEKQDQLHLSKTLFISLELLLSLQFMNMLQSDFKPLTS